MQASANANCDTVCSWLFKASADFVDVALNHKITEYFKPKAPSSKAAANPKKQPMLPLPLQDGSPTEKVPHTMTDEDFEGIDTSSYLGAYSPPAGSDQEKDFKIEGGATLRKLEQHGMGDNLNIEVLPEGVDPSINVLLHCTDQPIVPTSWCLIWKTTDPGAFRLCFEVEGQDKGIWVSYQCIGFSICSLPQHLMYASPEYKAQHPSVGFDDVVATARVLVPDKPDIYEVASMEEWAKEPNERDQDWMHENTCVLVLRQSAYKSSKVLNVVNYFGIDIGSGLDAARKSMVFQFCVAVDNKGALTQSHKAYGDGTGIVFKDTATTKMKSTNYPFVDPRHFYMVVPEMLRKKVLIPGGKEVVFVDTVEDLVYKQFHRRPTDVEEIFYDLTATYKETKTWSRMSADRQADMLKGMSSYLGGAIAGFYGMEQPDDDAAGIRNNWCYVIGRDIRLHAEANKTKMASVVAGGAVTIVSKDNPTGTYNLEDAIDAHRRGQQTPPHSPPNVSPFSPIDPAIFAAVVGGLSLVHNKQEEQRTQRKVEDDKSSRITSSSSSSSSSTQK